MLKKISFLIIYSILCINNHLFAQISISAGPEFGINIANVNVTPSITTDSRTGFIMGGLIDIRIKQRFEITSGMRFIMKGYTSTSERVTFKAKLNYLEIPVLAKVLFPLTEIKPFINAGPVLGINLSAIEEQSSGSQYQNIDISNAVESIDFSLLFGAGMDFSLASKVNLFVQFGYELGLSNWLKNNPQITAKNYGIQITAGAKFKI